MSDEPEVIASGWAVSMDVEIERPSNPYARISEIAAKVGVEPSDRQGHGIFAEGADGKYYNIFEVVIAVLDKLEKAT